MSSLQPKKLLLLNILDILQKYSDEKHRLSQQQIIAILKEKYDMSADRKSVKRNLMDLQEFGIPLNYSETLRTMPGKNGQPEESYILSDFYIERQFTDSELRLLIDAVIFSKHIPAAAVKELTKKLESLSGIYFRSNARFITALSQTTPQNPELFYTIEILDEAISQGKQVTFSYTTYDTDLKQHLICNADGDSKIYVVNPYQMAAANGRYYLIGNCQKYDNVIHFRLDRIRDIRLSDTPRKPMQEVQDLTNGLQLPKHMAEHLYMFAGESILVTFRMKKSILNDVIDWFGTDLILYDETEDEVTARVLVNWSAMRHWALQYARHIVVMTPEDLRAQISEDLQEAVKAYNGGVKDV